jgi:hypothetical protein
MRGDCMFCWDERWLYVLLRWEMIVCFVEMRGDCMLCWDQRWLYVLLRSQQNIQSPLISTKHTITSHLNKTYNHLWSQQNIQSPLISTKHLYALLRSEVIVCVVEMRGDCMLCWDQRWLYVLLRWEVIACFHLSSQQNIQSPLISTKHTITSHLNKTYNHLSSQQNIQSPLISTKHTITSQLYVLLRWEVIVCFVEIRGDCMFCWDERWLYVLLSWEVIVCCVEMRGDCIFCWDERWLYVLLSSQQNIQSPLISTKHTITSHLNKTYNHLSSQQSIQSPLISIKHTITSHLKSLNIGKPRHMMLGIHVLDGKIWTKTWLLQEIRGYLTVRETNLQRTTKATTNKRLSFRAINITEILLF